MASIKHHTSYARFTVTQRTTMPRNNPTGMGSATALRFRKMANDIQMFNQSNYDDRYQHHINSPTYPPQSTSSHFGQMMRNLFR